MAPSDGGGVGRRRRNRRGRGGVTPAVVTAAYCLLVMAAVAEVAGSDSGVRSASEMAEEEVKRDGSGARVSRAPDYNTWRKGKRGDDEDGTEAEGRQANPPEPPSRTMFSPLSFLRPYKRKLVTPYFVRDADAINVILSNYLDRVLTAARPRGKVSAPPKEEESLATMYPADGAVDLGLLAVQRRSGFKQWRKMG